MTKTQIQAKIQTLEDEDGQLCRRRDEIKAKFDKPTQWMDDEDFKAISRARAAIADELENLNQLLEEIKDQEWVERQAANYPDGQV